MRAPDDAPSLPSMDDTVLGRESERVTHDGRSRAAFAVLLVATAITAWLPFAWAACAHGIATVAYLLLLRALLAGRVRPSLTLALLSVIVLRLCCLPQPLSLSDDVYRSMHEGRLLLAGVNPYAVAPAAVDAALRGPYHALINNPTVPAAYPPAVLYLCALGASLSDHPLGIKLVFGLLDVVVFLALWRGLLPALGLPAERALVYGWCPLLATEIAGQGHNDAVVACGLVMALAAAACGRAIGAGVALAIATAGKLLPILLLPFVLRSVRARFASAAAFALTLMLLYAPFASAPEHLLRGTLEYVGRWRSNETLYALIHAGTEVVARWAGFEHADWLWVREPQRLAKLPVGLLLLAVLAWCWRRRCTATQAALALVVAFVAVTPTLHPWYLALLVPLLCVRPNLGWLLFTGTVFLAYHVLPAWHAERRWEEQPLVKAIEYVPFYAGLLQVWWHGRRAAGR